MKPCREVAKLSLCEFYLCESAIVFMTFFLIVDNTFSCSYCLFIC